METYGISHAGQFVSVFLGEIRYVLEGDVSGDFLYMVVLSQGRAQVELVGEFGRSPH